MEGIFQLNKNPISMLQELATAKFKRLPDYSFEEVKLQEFKCTLKFCDFTKEATAKSKKLAKNLVAELMLEELGIAYRSPCVVSNSEQSSPKVSSTTEEDPKYSFSSTNYSECSGSLSNQNCSASVAPVTCASNELNFQKMEVIGTSFLKSLHSDKMDCSEPSECFVSASPSSSSDSYQSVKGSNFFCLDNKQSVSNVKNEIPPLSNLDLCFLDPVSTLEATLLKSNVIPEYELVDVHETAYYYEVTGLGQSAIGSGSTKKEAKANAALSLMDILKIKYKEPEIKKDVNTTQHNFVGNLITFCQNNNIIGSPKYELMDSKGDPHCKIFTMRCSIKSKSVDCSAKTKKQAKNLCARAMLEELQKNIDQFKIHEMTFQSNLHDTDINEKMFKRLDKCGARNRILSGSALTKYPLNDYIHLFENNFYGKSDTLQQLKSSSPRQINTLLNPFEMFTTIANELSIQYRLNTMPSKKNVVFNLYLECNPNWSFTEKGSTKDEAMRKIACSALEFLYWM